METVGGIAAVILVVGIVGLAVWAWRSQKPVEPELEDDYTEEYQTSGFDAADALRHDPVRCGGNYKCDCDCNWCTWVKNNNS